MEYALGVLVSIVVEIVKRYFATDTLKTYVTLACVSLLVGGVYVGLSMSSFWPVLVQVITVSAAFHNLVIRRV